MIKGQWIVFFILLQAAFVGAQFSCSISQTQACTLNIYWVNCPDSDCQGPPFCAEQVENPVCLQYCEIQTLFVVTQPGCCAIVDGPMCGSCDAGFVMPVTCSDGTVLCCTSIPCACPPGSGDDIGNDDDDDTGNDIGDDLDDDDDDDDDVGNISNDIGDLGNDIGNDIADISDNISNDIGDTGDIDDDVGDDIGNDIGNDIANDISDDLTDDISDDIDDDIFDDIFDDDIDDIFDDIFESDPVCAYQNSDGYGQYTGTCYGLTCCQGNCPECYYDFDCASGNCVHGNEDPYTDSLEGQAGVCGPRLSCQANTVCPADITNDQPRPCRPDDATCYNPVCPAESVLCEGTCHIPNCFSSTQCDDQNAFTFDYCYNPGLCTSDCEHIQFPPATECTYGTGDCCAQPSGQQDVGYCQANFGSNFICLGGHCTDPNTLTQAPYCDSDNDCCNTSGQCGTNADLKCNNTYCQRIADPVECTISTIETQVDSQRVVVLSASYSGFLPADPTDPVKGFVRCKNGIALPFDCDPNENGSGDCQDRACPFDRDQTYDSAVMVFNKRFSAICTLTDTPVLVCEPSDSIESLGPPNTCTDCLDNDCGGLTDTKDPTQCPAPACNNGLAEPGETCGEPGLPVCGGTNACVNCKCTNSLAVCGNGNIETAEQCGEPTLPDCASGYTCDSLCRCEPILESCNNGQIDYGEECDFAGTESFGCQAGFVCNACYCIPETLSGPQLVIKDIIPEPIVHPAGATLQNLELVIQNLGSQPCPNARLTAQVTDIDNNPILPPLMLDTSGISISFAVGETKTFLFNATSSPSLFDTSQLTEGTYGIQVSAYCPQTTENDHKTTFLTIGPSNAFSIPETNPVFVFVLLTIICIMVYSKTTKPEK